MYDDVLLLSNNINRLPKKTTSDLFTTLQDVLPPNIFYILCHRCPYPLDMVLTSLPGTIFELRASEVSDVAAAKQQAQCGCCAGPKSLFGLGLLMTKQISRYVQ